MSRAMHLAGCPSVCCTRLLKAHSTHTSHHTQVLLTMVTKLMQAITAGEKQGQSSLASRDALNKLIAARPELTSVPFMLWVAQQESAASGESKQVLHCESGLRC